MSNDQNHENQEGQEDLDRYFNDPEYRRKQLEKRRRQQSSGNDGSSFNLSNDENTSKQNPFNLSNRKETTSGSTDSEEPDPSNASFSDSRQQPSEAGTAENSAGPNDSKSDHSGFEPIEPYESYASSDTGGSDAGEPPEDSGGGGTFGNDGNGSSHHRISWSQIFQAFGYLVLTFLLLSGVFFVYLIQGLPSLEELENPRTDMASFVMSRDGEVLDTYFTENRTSVRYEEISPHIVDALIATEDHRYYGHWGMDMYRTLAIPYHLMRGEMQGGSTISQQLARNLYRQIGREVNVQRKLREMITAIQIERNFTKKEIIEMYLNTVEFSNSSYGIETAALTHFNKPAQDLNPLEAAVLIGSLKATSTYNPRTNPDRSRMRRNVVLSQMARHGFIDYEQLNSWREEPIELDYNPPFSREQTRYFGEYVRQQVSDWAEENGYDLRRDGLIIQTTIDSRLQQHAQNALEEQVQVVQGNYEDEWTSDGSDEYMDQFWEEFSGTLDIFIRGTDRFRKKVEEGFDAEDAINTLKTNEAFIDSVKRSRTRIEGGFVAIDPSNGEIRSWVGGTDYGSIQRDNVYQTRRQAGSTFKPFIYALAIDNGYRPHHKFSKYPVSFYDASGQRWSPRDPRIDHLEERVPLRDALARSLNNVTVRLLPELSGNPDTNRLEDLYEVSGRIADLAQQMGINRQEMIREPSIVLGTAETSLLELTNAYATFVNQGVNISPMAIVRIEDNDGNVLTEFQNQHQEEVINPETAYYVIDMMRDVVRRGTGQRLRWGYGVNQDIAGKTGTTNRSADAWFVGMTPQLVMGAWIGGEDRYVRFPQGSYVGQGARSALPVVGRFIRSSRQDPDVDWSTQGFQQPQGMIMEVEDDELQRDDEDRPSRITW